MKKLIVLILLLGAGTFFVTKKKQSEKKTSEDVLRVDLRTEKEEQKVLEVKQAIVKASHETPTLESLKDQYENDQNLKSEKDFLGLIQKKEKEMTDLKLIEKANAGVLNKEEAAQLLTLIRERMALHQIVLDMKMKKFDRKYL
jgi:hypothetical protein